jgi:DNA invertase Pin-like site-specific DNA recombinase
MAIVEENPTNKRKIGYCRVSTDKQSINNQIIELKKHGIASKDIYRDDDVSGTVAPTSRKGFKKVYDLIMKGEVSELYIFEISRLGRNIAESLTVFIEIEKKGTKILSMSPNEDWTHTQTKGLVYSWRHYSLGSLILNAIVYQSALN